MKNLFILFILTLSSVSFSQTPGGVQGEDLWYKTGEDTAHSMDYGPNSYPVFRNGTLPFSLFNYNHTVDFEAGYLNFNYSVEDMKVATVFMVYTNPESGEQSLLHSEWANGIDQGTGDNEKKFSYTTKTLVKEDFSLDYPEDSEEEVSNALVNTLNWFDFESTHINNSTGTGGESTVFVGKANSSANASAFNGLIPEFIIYRKALSKEERQRVESYLAIKYGITLTADADYFNSAYEEIWGKENNEVFGNRIIAIGRDDVSGLYQKQSTSSHTENKEIILNIDELADNNDLNEGTFEDDQQFIFIGDNNGSTEAETDPETIPETDPEVGIGDWQLHFIGRKWLAHPYGSSADDIVTELRYNAAQLFDQIHQDYDEEYWDDITVWLFINRSGDEQEAADFSDFNQVEHYMPDATEGNHVVYKGLSWDGNLTGFDQFTFAVGPKMLVDIELQEMECTDTLGTIDVELTFGEPNFDFSIYDENDNLVDSEIDWATRNISFNNLSNGWYTLKVEDATGYTREVEFEVSPTAGMNEDLLEDEYALISGYVTLDASEHVTAENVTYEWFAESVSIGNSAEITLDKPGTYEVVATNANGCQVSDTTLVTEDPNKPGHQDEGPVRDDRWAGESIRIYPNPTKVNQAFTVEINLIEEQDVNIQIFDFAGSLLYHEELKEIKNGQWTHRIFQPGSYLIIVTTPHHQLTKKLIIE